MIKPNQYTKLLKKRSHSPKNGLAGATKKSIRSLSVFGRMTLSKGQEKELDTLWSKAVKSRAGNKCERCPKIEPLQSHHCIGRRNKTLRHVVSNGCCLCAGCHFFAEQNGIAFAKWILEKRGEQWWTDLVTYGREIKCFKDYTVIKSYLEAFI